MKDAFARWFESLPPARRAALAESYAAGLAADGLSVYHADADRFVPIAPSLSPEILDEEELAALAADAEALLAATVKACLFTLSPAGRGLAELLYATFTPLERAALARDPARLAQVATARVDYFRGPGGVVRALELNATIPAMQGYSDLILHRWLRLVAGERGVPAEPLVARAGSNTADLLASLLAHYRKAGGAGDRPSIVIVSRRGDSQLGELRHYERAFAAAGHRAVHAWVDELGVDARGRVTARGEPFELLYRHIFARRVDAESVLGKLLVEPGPTIVLNPVLSPLEVKGVFAVLHQDLEDPALPLDERERDAVRRRVPWTRVLRAAPASTPDGELVPDLAAWAAANADRVVLKRSWDYGGKGVFIGPDAGSEPARARMRELYGPAVHAWADLVRAAAEDPNVWVLQELVPPPATSHLLVTRDAGGRPAWAWHDVYVDVNAYACLGVEARPRGGVCRASASRIVNIAGGGGVAPLVTSRLARSLLEG
jgi:hypothetical protein